MQDLLAVRPFLGLDASSDPYFLQEGHGAQASNVDVSYRLGAFATAHGRALYGAVNVPAGYTIQGHSWLVSFVGDHPDTVRRIYVFSAVNGTGGSYQGWYEQSTGITTQLPNAQPFTQAVQFGSALWTNGGDKIYFLTNGKLDSDEWQLSVPYSYAYQVTGTYATTAGNAPSDTYTYAITLRKAESWSVGTVIPFTFAPDIDSLQESSPIFSTSVTVVAGQQPGFTVPTSIGLSSLIQGLTVGGDTYYGCVYRSSVLNPTYVFVDYMANLQGMNDHTGQFSIIDTYSADQIADNAYLTIHHDPPPILGLTYSGATALNSTPSTVQQAQQQVSFTYRNPAFITKHKSRMWTFTLYPTEAIGPTPSVSTLSFQPQLWFSDYGVPWSHNAAKGFLLVGPEDTPGNAPIDSNANAFPPWEPGQLEDTPMGLATTGSILCALKTQSFWIVQGDTPAEFIPRRAFDIGCMASNSITTAEGGVFWLAPQGVYFFDGGAPAYISEPVRGLLEAQTWADRQAAVGSYRDRTFFLSIGSTTYCYYTPTKKWYTRPYGCTLAISAPFNQNQLLFLEGSSLYSVDAAVASDLGSAIVSTWQSAVSDSGAPGKLKEYRMLQVVAPNQPGTIKVTLTLDPNFATASTQSWTWKPSLGNGAFVASINKAGYEAQLTIEATTDTGASAPMIIRSAVVHGEAKRGLGSTSLQDLSGQFNGVTNG